MPGSLCNGAVGAERGQVGGLNGMIDARIVIRRCYRWGVAMTTVTVSPKYQIVIPKEIRESMGIVSGQKVQIMSYQGRIEVIPLKPMQEMKGFLMGIDTAVPRDEDRL
jgi:AbrB family looped-hinge helix DNA binding protein